MPTAAELTGIAGRRGQPADADTRAGQPRHAGPGGAAAVQRPLSRDGHQRGRRLQPLEGPGRDALARRRHPRPLGHLLLPARRRRAARSGPPRTSPTLQRARSTTRRSSRKGARSFAAATATSIPIPRSSYRRKTTSNCAGCASPTVPATRRTIEVTSYAEVVLAPRRRRRPASGVQQSLRADRDRRGAPGHPVHAPAALPRRAGALDVSPDGRARRGRSASFPTRPTARASSAAAAASPRPGRWTPPGRCPAARARCSTRWWPSAAGSPSSRSSRSAWTWSTASATAATRRWAWSRNTRIGAWPTASSSWPGPTPRWCCARSTPARRMRSSTRAWPTR